MAHSHLLQGFMHGHPGLRDSLSRLNDAVKSQAGGASLRSCTQECQQAVREAQLRQQGLEDKSSDMFLHSVANQLEAFHQDLSSHLDAPSQTTTSSWLHLLQGAQEFLQGNMGLTALPQVGVKDRSSMDSVDSSCSSSTCGSSIASSTGSRLSRKLVASRPGAGYNAMYARKVAI
ncbi:hypothetical protein DUNSADRAFT_14236 [Dunaliella salina]|uniref:Uncharacterized protein n=1 Tax=Dunaliella salina TaxID=3046 RepID=A0ABQ7G7R4_DUNSA|nr:hypothetical protein DUNSADRAFT_14236 [Dunaliella salina]|eukprot:KAF5830635.1 hypothetical protein DUNSADRAFT_14236 [Dunaliella salina]